MPTDSTALTQRRYDRIAPVYDLLEVGCELFFRGWRHELWARVPAGRVLEVGVGTGKNLPFHGSTHQVTGIDLSPRMLERARRRAARLGVGVELRQADVEHLPFDDNSFDSAVASFVFCSVAAPLRGLQEVRRVLVPGGRLLLLEHVLSRNPLVRPLMRLLDPLPHLVWGAHIDRETGACVRQAGFEGVFITPRFSDIVVEFHALAPVDA